MEATPYDLHKPRELGVVLGKRPTRNRPISKTRYPWPGDLYIKFIREIAREHPDALGERALKSIGSKMGERAGSAFISHNHGRRQTSIPFSLSSI